MSVPLNDPAHWLDRAKEARALADQMADPEAKRRMLVVADDYMRLAKRAEARAAGQLLDEGEEANPLQRGWVGADGNRVLPKLFWSGYASVTLSGKNWSEQERAEIGRLEAMCSETNHWSLDCDHTDAGDPWCVIYDQQHHSGLFCTSRASNGDTLWCGRGRAGLRRRRA